MARPAVVAQPKQRGIAGGFELPFLAVEENRFRRSAVVDSTAIEKQAKFDKTYQKVIYYIL